MSGLLARPRGSAGSKGFGPALRDVVLALVVMNSAVFFWQSGRIEKDCLCSHASALTIEIVTGVLVGGFALGLLAFAAYGWWTGPPHGFRRFLTEERHHLIAAIVPWIMAILGIVLLTVPSQTADMLAGLQGTTWTEIHKPWLPFGAGALIWGLSTWFCGRWAIDIERRSSRRPESFLALWNPRLIALLTGFAIIIITVKAAGLCSFAMVVASVVAGIVVLLAVLRRPVARLFNPAWRSGGAARLAASHRAGKNRWEEFIDDMRTAPGGPVALLTALGLSVVVIGLYAVAPELAGGILQAPGTVLLGIGCLTVIATFLSKFGLRLAHFPVLICLVAFTTLLGRLDIGVNHDIRTLPATTVSTVPIRTLDQAAEEWLKTCGSGLAAGTSDLKVVLVSTAGGASRAALWTLNALADLEANDRQFPRRLFTISAVSGGALGSAVWSALLARENFDCRTVIPDDTAATARRSAGQAILSHDFLAPVLAVWLSRDVTLGVVPFVNSVLRRFGVQIGDRSSALEQTWESAWAAQFETEPNLFAADFMALWGTTFDRPLLLLNGTVEDTGQPIVTAPIALVDTRGQSDGGFPATYDARWLLHREIRTSTAVLNAARFPVVTSQGDIRLRLCPDGANFAAGSCAEKVASKPRVLSVVDGGYFDNIGGGTTLRAANALTAAFARLQKQEHLFPGVTLRIMVVGINSDPARLISPDAWKWLDPTGYTDTTVDVPVDQVMRCGETSSTLTIDAKGLDNTLDNEIAPALAIIATQSGHTALRMAELNQQFCSPRANGPTLTWPTNYVMLSLCPIGDDKGTVSLPLNWTLPQTTLDLFAGRTRWDLAKTECENVTQFNVYRDWAALP